MPLRFATLTNVPSTVGTPRQPVPEQFKRDRRRVDAEVDASSAYFDWLYSEAGRWRGPFMEQLSRAVHAFNMATSPKDLGLSDKKYHFKIWRGKEKAAVLNEEDVVSIG